MSMFNTRLASFIKEQYDDNFTTEVNVDLNDHELRDVDPDISIDTAPDVKIVYALDIEYRSWGIKEITPRIIAIGDITLEYTVYGDEDTEEYKLATVKMSDVDVNQIEKEFSISEYGLIVPKTLELTIDSNFAPILEQTKLIF